MAYGRLDVFYPDGNFRSFGLKDNNISVGRSPGNTVQLDSETLSRYHFSVTHADGAVYLNDLESQNGTYIDGVKVPDGERRELRGGEEILAGEMRLIYHVVDEMPTQPVRPAVDTTQRIESANINFEISVQPPPIAVPPGAHASAELSVFNRGEEAQTYLVDVEGVPRDWLRVDRPKLMVGAEASEQIIINFRPSRHPNTEPGEYPVTLTVREEDNPSNSLTVSTHVRILPYSGLGVALERKHVSSGESFRLHMHNQGNADLPLAIGGGRRTNNVTLDFETPTQVTLQPGQRTLVKGRARPVNNRLLGGAETYPFDVVIRSQDPSQFMAVVQGKVTQHALLPRWVPAAATVGLVALIGVMIGLFAFLTAPQPSVTDLQVATTSIPRGEPLVIQWQAEDVTNLQLLVNETPVADLPPEERRYTLQTDTLEENAVISVVGAARNSSARLDQSVRVYDPIVIETFNAQPAQLVRHVVQTLDLSWAVQNADFVQINGLEPFNDQDITGQDLDPVSSVEGLVGIVTDDLALTLYAEDALGNARTEQLVIPSVPPQCTPEDEPLTLRDGPDTLNQAVGTVPVDATVTVNARDVSGAWVRVQLEGGVSGWGALAGLTCADTFNPANLQQEINVTPPPTAPTETNTPAPTATRESQGAVPTPQPTTAG